MNVIPAKAGTHSQLLVEIMGVPPTLKSGVQR